ncbi:phospholipid-transporting ATPase ID-like isoform X5 [Lineus longissimus]|uniref:phospholipid-transporting ATPase ID-like isoform X5 n=1 Tax=Lineus longissimus TaxID=88925 RepID=UPI00315D2460
MLEKRKNRRYRLHPMDSMQPQLGDVELKKVSSLKKSKELFDFKRGKTETKRKLRANDSEYNAAFQYANNYISTSKYNFLTFVPKNLFEQFQRIANAYFLGLLILQLIPWISSLTPLTTIIPLVGVLMLTAAKDAFDDIQRHRSDNRVNNRLSHVLRNGKVVDEVWHKVVVGDIIKMVNNQFVAADLLLLSSSEPNSLCYVETAELDGETNLKVRQAIPEIAEMGDNEEELAKFDGSIQCEPPNNRLGKYDGTLTWEGQQFSLDNEKLLLRGCVLRNTEWCYGLVVFAGKDTKLMQNCGKTTLKRTHIDRLVNILIIGIFIFLLSICLLCTICSGVWETLIGQNFQAYMPWDFYIPGGPSKEGTKAAGATVIALLVFLSYIIILNTVVPISLYVSVEVLRMAHSFWINWDEKMYHAKTDTPAHSRTTTLNEELGQIEYIFSDKTGTLTQNIMSFMKCSINAKSFGDAYDELGNKLEIGEKTPRVDFSDNPMSEPKFEFFDKALVQAVKSGDSDCHDFFRLLALCHTVMPEEKDGVLEYQAQSPDEGALVSAARNFGFVFRSRTPTTITIEVNGNTEVYELLCILDFNNVRKRMSVIVRKDGKIKLLCKGADNVIFERLGPKCRDLQELTTSHLSDFANEGLRTLCLAQKDISEEYYNSWKKDYHDASCAMELRDERLDEVYEQIEKDLELIGASAIEDKLQDGVPDAIANLALAGIKIWVLTGDKQETAINIGYSCKLLTDEMEDIFIIDGDSYQTVEDQIEGAKTVIKKSGNYPGVDVSFQTGSKTPLQPNENGTVGEQVVEDGDGVFALVINGHSLVYALDPKMEMLFLEVASLCKAVICCRVTPLQKALVVDLVKENKKAVTLAIGDGANDVSMIKTAHIGVGISGQEGMQAVLASDFSIAQFRYVERLLLVHGRWSYLRMCKFLKYFFYKNFSFTLCHFWFAFFCGFSAQTLLDPFFISCYNLFFTSLPILALGSFEQDVNDDYSTRYPKLYVPGQRNILFNKKVFAWSVIEGFLTSFALFFISYGALKDMVRPDGLDMADHHSFGVTVASILIVVVTLRCALDTIYWTGFNHFVIWGSIVFYFAFTFVLYADIWAYSYIGTGRNVMATASFWFTMLLTVVILLAPIIAWRFYNVDTTPTLSDRVRLRQRISKSKSKATDLTLRRSFSRRSTRSLRSGYAFSHQEGFGELITSGKNMRASFMDSRNEKKPG